ncbi:MAG TPA: HIT domain-containing protein [Mycobacteriales bacterium]|nr:HIT domain-containing protein [Mycobacteriales bacterium]
MTTDVPACLFCRIVAGEIPAEIVHETVGTLAFRDVNPQAPTHILVVPRTHYDDVGALAAADATLLNEVIQAAVAAAAAAGLDSGYRLVTNTGADAGQSVGHLHVHVLGGRSLGWPPG